MAINTYRKFNDFRKGLNTDQNKVNENPETLTAIDNFYINNKGAAIKRKGLKKINPIELQHPPKEILDNKSVSTFLWTNTGKSINDILIVQWGVVLKFYEYKDGEVLSRFPDELLIDDYLTSEALLLEDLSVKFNKIKNKIIITHKQMTPVILSYRGGYSITIEELQLFSRDYFEDNSFYDILQRKDILDPEHMHKLYNAGWEYYQQFYMFEKVGFLPALSESTSKFITAYKAPDSYLLSAQADANRRGVADEKYKEAIGGVPFFPDVTANGILLKETFPNAYKRGSLDAEKEVEEPRGDQESKGKRILNIYGSGYDQKIVSRPILEAGEESIDRTKWNSFHLIDVLHDIFLDENKVKMVITFDKEHGLKGGNQEELTTKVSMTIKHRDLPNQTKMESGLASRIYSYDFSPLLADSMNYVDGDMATKPYDEALFWRDLQGINDYLIDEFMKVKAHREDLNPMNNDGKTLFLLRNLTTNPLDYKASILLNEADSYYAAALVNRDYYLKSLGGLNTLNYKPGVQNTRQNSYSNLLLPTGHWDQVSNINSGITFDSPYYIRGAKADYVTSNGNNVYCSLTNNIINPFTEYTGNANQYTALKVKYKDQSVIPVIEEKKFNNLNVTLKALSDKTAVLEFDEGAFDSLHPDWLFNIDEDGNLICYQDLYDTFKMELSSTLYNKMMKVYENIQRNKYASQKLDEEYAGNDDYYSVKDIASVVYVQEANDANDGFNGEDNFGRYVVTFELDKEHGRKVYRAPASATGDSYEFYCNIIQGLFTKHTNVDYDFLIPTRARYTYNTDTYNSNLISSNYDYHDMYSIQLAKMHPKRLKRGEELNSYTQEVINEFNKMKLRVRTDVAVENVGFYRFPQNVGTAYFSNGPMCFIEGILMSATRFDSVDSNKGDNYAIRYDEDLYIVLDSMVHDNQSILTDYGWRVKGTSYATVSNPIPPNFTGGTMQGYYLPAQTVGSSNSYTYTEEQYENARYTQYDYLTCIDLPDSYNYNIEGRLTHEQAFTHAVGKNYIKVVFRPLGNERYTDETLTTSESLPMEYMFDRKMDGHFINTLNDLKNLKFSLNQTLDRATIQSKFNAYREEWTWEMDVGQGTETEVTEIDPDNLEFEDIIEEFRPSDCATLAGRVFYAGIETKVLSNTIFFSQIIEDERVKPTVEMCYSINDPTDPYFNSPLPTDGGFITIDGVDIVLSLEVVNGILCVVATNGVWAIYGVDGYFDPTNYGVKKISDVGCVSANSVKVMENSLIYAGEYSINLLQPNTDLDLDLVPLDLTNRRIDNLYKSIKKECKTKMKSEYDKVRGYYYLLYRDSETEQDEKDLDYNKLICYNISTDSIFTFSFGDSSTYKIKDMFIDDTISFEDIRVKFMVSLQDGSDLEIYDLSNDLFLDFDVEGYEGLLEFAGLQLTTLGTDITGGQFITHLLNSPNTSCLSSVDYDYKHTNKTSKEREMFKEDTNKEVIFKKQELRGEGSNLAIRYRSPAGFDCQLLGYELLLRLRMDK